MNKSYFITLFLTIVLFIVAGVETKMMVHKKHSITQSFVTEKQVSNDEVRPANNLSSFFYLIAALVFPLLLLHNKLKSQLFVISVAISFFFLINGIDETAANDPSCEECEAISIMALATSVVITGFIIPILFVFGRSKDDTSG